VFLDIGHGAGCDLAVEDEVAIEARGAAATQDGGEQFQLGAFLGDAARHDPGAVDARLRHVIIHRLGRVALALRDPLVHAGDRRADRRIAEIALHQRAGLFGINVAGEHQNRVGGAVILAEPVLHVFQRGGIEVFHRADRGVSVRVAFREERAQLGVFHHAVRLVVALALLVLHNAALLVEAVLVDGAQQVGHPVGFHPQRHFQSRRRHGLEIVGAVEPGRAVHAGRADLFERTEIIVIVVFRPVEHQVFEQVGEARAAGRFVGRTDAIPDGDGNDRRLAVLVDNDRQAVLELEALVRNVDLGRLGIRQTAKRDGRRERGRE
jgi:hypothetical protein